MFVDKNGLITQADGDGGDTAARTGEYFALRAMKDRLCIPVGPLAKGVSSFQTALIMLTPGNQLIRNPLRYNDAKDTSRDQARPMIIAAGLLGYSTIHLEPKGFIIKRYQNGDLASPENLNEIRRANNQSPSLLGDIWNQVAVEIRCAQAVRNGPDDVGDDINCFLTTAFFNVVSPNDTTKDSMRHYLKNRPMNYGNTDLGYSDPVMGAFAWYHRSATGGNPEIAEEARDLIKYFRKELNCGST